MKRFLNLKTDNDNINLTLIRMQDYVSVNVISIKYDFSIKYLIRVNNQKLIQSGINFANGCNFTVDSNILKDEENSNTIEVFEKGRLIATAMF